MSIVVAVALGCVLSLASTGWAGRFNKVLSVGDKAPTFKGVVGVDGKNYGLDDFKDKKVIVAVFTCNKCPVAIAYEDRIIQLQKEYADKGVQFVAINVNTNDEDKLDKMKERAEEKGFNFPYLYDESQQSARDFGATVTPHFFVLDQQRNVAYMGALDDSPFEQVKKEYLREALDAVLAGKQPATPETKQQGCGIAYN
ncbi:MAG: thioredoxin family protein [Pirellulales bacterium]|nr:thioredoxin family protein [Pirellulales bacterium]